MNRAELTHLFLFVVMVLLILGACQGDVPDNETDNLSDERPTNVLGELEELDPSDTLVIYWHSLQGADEAFLSELIDDYNASNEWGITVVGEYQGNEESIYKRVVGSIPAGQFPSLVMTDPSLAAAYVSQGIIVPLTPYLINRAWGFTPTERNDFFPSALLVDRLPQFRDQLYSFPFCRSLQVLYYNVDWLKELGHDTPPQTWDEFRAMACAASSPADGLYGFEFGMDSELFNSLLATQGAALLNPTATAYILGGKVGREGMQYLQNLTQDGCASWETERGHIADFAAGEILFAIDSTDKIPIYREAVNEGANFGWNLTNLPHTTEELLISSSGPGAAILPTAPKEQLAAWLFLKWLAEPGQQARWAQFRGCFPLRRSALEVMETHLQEHPWYNTAAQLLEQQWITEPNVTAYSECRAEIGRMLYVVTAGESVEEWMTNTQDLCNQALTSATN